VTPTLFLSALLGLAQVEGRSRKVAGYGVCWRLPPPLSDIRKKG